MGNLNAESVQALLEQAVESAGVKEGVLMKTPPAAHLCSLHGPHLLTTLPLHWFGGMLTLPEFNIPAKAEEVASRGDGHPRHFSRSYL